MNQVKKRNHLVVPMINRGGAGAHGKTKKAIRASDKVKLRKGNWND